MIAFHPPPDGRHTLILFLQFEHCRGIPAYSNLLEKKKTKNRFSPCINEYTYILGFRILNKTLRRAFTEMNCAKCDE